MGAGALGLGPERVVAVLGQPLEVVLPLHLEPADAAGNDCVEAEVAFGDERLPASQVRVRVEGGTPGSTERRVHVSTVPAVTEPVVSVVVKAGCRGEVAKKLVAFADPPDADEAATAAVAVPQKPRKEKAPASEPVAAASVPVPPSRAARSPLPSKAAPPSRQAARTERGSARPDRVALSGVQKEKGAKQRRQTSSSPPATTAQRGPSASGSPRLTLEPAERPGPPRPEPAAAAPPLAQAVPALAPALPPAPPAPAEAARVQALEQTLTELRRELTLTRQSLDAMERRSVQAAAPAMIAAPLRAPPTAPVPAWVHVLATIAAVLAAATGWLLLQMRRDRRRERGTIAPPASLPAETPLRQQGAVVPRAAADLFASPPALPQDAPAFPAPPAPASGSLAPETPPFGPSPRPAMASAVPRPARSPLEDLLDLDQQVEFFIALGQETVAVELLQSVIDEERIRSPLPWLMLMGLHQCLEERPAFERVRARFAERFSVAGPGWETDLRRGRVLDDCPELVEPLERLWPTPQAAVTLLEALLLQTDERAGRLELPVCLDLLLLYSLLRERPELKAQADAPALVPPAPAPSSARAAAAAAARTPDWPPPFPGTVPSAAPLETIEFEPLSFDLPLAPGGGTRAP